MRRRSLLLVALIALCLGGRAAADSFGWCPRLVYHDIKADEHGIVPWYDPDPATSYDHVIRSVWAFWRDMRACPNGVPYYLQHQVWTPETDDPRGLGGDQLAMALSSWNLLHAYLGDPALVANMQAIADYYLAHGLSPSSAAWPNLPYPYNTSVHSGTYDGDMRAGKGFLQPDKAAAFGRELVTLYKITGEREYLRAAVAIADTLASRVKRGDAAEGPWPFRVHAERPGTPAEKDAFLRYTTNWTGALWLFEELSALHEGNTASYRRAHDLTLAWLRRYPLRTNAWGPFFEDIREYSDTAINADTMVLYILDHKASWPGWRDDARRILDGSMTPSTATSSRCGTSSPFTSRPFTACRATAIRRGTRRWSSSTRAAPATGRGRTRTSGGSTGRPTWSTPTARTATTMTTCG